MTKNKKNTKADQEAALLTFAIILLALICTTADSWFNF